MSMPTGCSLAKRPVLKRMNRGEINTREKRDKCGMSLD
jgi:hypothetical protein